MFLPVGQNTATALHRGRAQAFVGCGRTALQHLFLLPRIAQLVVAVQQSVERALGTLVHLGHVGKQPFQQFRRILGTPDLDPLARHMLQLLRRKISIRQIGTLFGRQRIQHIGQQA